MKKRLIIAGLLVLVAVAGVLSLRSRNRSPENVLALSGNVEVTEINMGFKFSGRVTGLLAEEGQMILKGDRLAVLDSAEFESQVEQSMAYLSETLARLSELKAGSRPQEVERARADVSRADAELVKSRKDYDRAEALYKKDVISAQQLDAARKSFDVASSQLKNAHESLSLVKEGPRKETIRAAEDRVKQAAAALKVSEERLKDTLLYAPVSGVVLRKNVELGETVGPGTPVYTIGEIETPWVKVYVKEDKLGLVKLGQRAEITTDSYPGRKYEGTVTYISSEAEFTPKNVQTQEERVKLVFGVKVSTKNESRDLKPGMPADVKIILK